MAWDFGDHMSSTTENPCCFSRKVKLLALVVGPPREQWCTRRLYRWSCGKTLAPNGPKIPYGLRWRVSTDPSTHIFLCRPLRARDDGAVTARDTPWRPGRWGTTMWPWHARRVGQVLGDSSGGCAWPCCLQMWSAATFCWKAARIAGGASCRPWKVSAI